MNTSPYGSGPPLVVDTSAWVRQRDPSVRDRWRATVVAGRIAICPAAALELLASARDQEAFLRLDYLVAAAAAERGFGVLHLDGHYDVLATVLAFESVRIDR